ncbi:oxygenase MpaB family protein [Hymenobacter sp. BT730]|uniref:oxygenase MpaB family protein n=1 Tax=Hymenobacter sp. BT730 TaxID=3063332 RepID=UPI0026DF6406|nr:oxygenase MpaB family protein [Hymenobacter sp. BT730]
MSMSQCPEYFVSPNSVVRTIWGKADTVLFIFAGAAAEFALNKAVDWLYFTGRLPADPLARLFSTVEYARQIVFAKRPAAEQAIDTITAIHSAVEAKRGMAIPAWAYRDVLFMLVDYSIRAFEVLERPLSQAEQEEVFEVFIRVGQRMGIPDLPTSYAEWRQARQEHLESHLEYSHFTADLYQQYARHLGPVRYRLLLQAQRVVAPPPVSRLLRLGRTPWLLPALFVYRYTQHLPFSKWARASLLPEDYKEKILRLDIVPPSVLAAAS